MSGQWCDMSCQLAEWAEQHNMCVTRIQGYKTTIEKERKKNRGRQTEKNVSDRVTASCEQES